MLAKIALAVNCQGQNSLTEEEQQQSLVILHDNQSAAIVVNTGGYTRLACACCMSEPDKEVVRDAIRMLPREMSVAVFCHPDLTGEYRQKTNLLEGWSLSDEHPAFLSDNMKKFELTDTLSHLNSCRKEYAKLLAEPKNWSALQEKAEQRVRRARRELEEAQWELKNLGKLQENETKLLAELPGEIAKIPTIEAEFASIEARDLIGG